jgi:nucleoside-diphosphate-sugar epimerase
LGGRGFVGSNYVKAFYDPAVGNIASINGRDNYNVFSKDVLYFISTVHNYHVFDAPLRDIDTNLTTLVQVLESWRARPDARDGVFNFISSWFVYGGSKIRHDVHESEYCDPKGFYSITKRCAEQLLASYCATYGLKYRILRLANVLGDDLKASAKKNALQYMIGQLSRNEPVQIYGTGDFHRDYIHVNDCVTAIDLVITHGDLNQIYNIGNGKTWKFKDIIQHVRERLGSKSDVTFIEPKDFHKIVQSTSFYMNVDSLKGLGYIPTLTEETLWESTYENFDSSGEC